MAGNARSAGSEDFVGALAIQDRIRETSAVGSFASAIAGSSRRLPLACPAAPARGSSLQGRQAIRNAIATYCSRSASVSQLGLRRRARESHTSAGTGPVATPLHRFSAGAGSRRASRPTKPSGGGASTPRGPPISGSSRSPFGTSSQMYAGPWTASRGRWRSALLQTASVERTATPSILRVGRGAKDWKSARRPRRRIV